jgi:hypothetical protein
MIILKTAVMHQTPPVTLATIPSLKPEIHNTHSAEARRAGRLLHDPVMAEHVIASQKVRRQLRYWVLLRRAERHQCTSRVANGEWVHPSSTSCCRATAGWRAGDLSFLAQLSQSPHASGKHGKKRHIRPLQLEKRLLRCMYNGQLDA